MSKTPEKIPLNLTVSETVELASGLNQLNTYPEKVNGQVVFLPFLFPMQTKINIAKNQRLARAAVSDYESNFKALTEEFFPTKSEVLEGDRKTSFERKHKELQDAIIQLDLIQLERDVIVSDNSPIAPNIWLALEKIFDKPL